MKVYYSLKENKKVTESTNEDLELAVNSDNNHLFIELISKNDIKLEKAVFEEDIVVDDTSKMFFNGIQSWTDSIEHTTSFVERDVYKIPSLINKIFTMDGYGDYRFYKYNKNILHGYDIFYIKGKSQYFGYSLNYKNAFLSFEVNKKQKSLTLISLLDNIELKSGERYVIFDFKHFSNYEEGLASFYEDFPKQNKEKILGYTSWYNYREKISEDIIKRDLEALDSRFNLFQIDDGFQEHTGDWLNIDKNKFPNGLKPIVDEVHSKGYKCGIWLAPLMAEEKSDLFINHKELFARYEDGSFVKCGCNWSGSYALDLTKKEVWDYIEKHLNIMLT